MTYRLTMIVYAPVFHRLRVITIYLSKICIFAVFIHPDPFEAIAKNVSLRPMGTN